MYIRKNMKLKLALGGVPVLPFVMTVSLPQNILVFLIFAWFICEVAKKCPEEGYRIKLKLTHVSTVVTLGAFLGVIFYRRWIPSGFLLRVANIVGISNKIVLIMITAIGCIPLVISIELFSQIIPIYLKSDAFKVTVEGSERYLDSLQIIRVIACIEVVCFHYSLGGSGRVGVSLFFVLSGFLMVYNHYDDKRINNNSSLCEQIMFAYRRVKKLYPLHIALVIIACFVIPRTTILSEVILKLLLQGTLTQSWIPSETYFYCLNGVTWYLSSCVFFYFIFYKYISIIRNYKNVNSAYAMMISLFVLQCAVGCLINNIFSLSEELKTYIYYVCPLTRIGDFIIGCNMGYVFLMKKCEKVDKWLFTWQEICCVILLLIINKINVIFPDWFGSALVILPFSTIIIWTFAWGKGLISNILKSCSIIKYCAQISPYVFLSHVMVLYCCRKILFGDVFPQLTKLESYFTVGISFVVSIAISCFYNRIINKEVKRCFN